MELLSVPKTKLRSYGDKAFSFYAPKVWNNLPYDIRSCQSLTQFKKEIKTFLKDSLQSSKEHPSL